MNFNHVVIPMLDVFVYFALFMLFFETGTLCIILATPELAL